ncbi:MAG: hypothetical protein ABIB71_06375 [Candidatus Woesearchaeota archaeon]
MVRLALNKGLDDFLSGYSKLGTPEERQENKVEGSVIYEDVKHLITLYKIVLAQRDEFSSRASAFKGISTILNPEEINSFLQATRDLEGQWNYASTGFVISSLIQNSYDAGHNKFHLDTSGLKEIGFMGSYIKGVEGNPLEIEVNGDLRYAAGSDSEYLLLVLRGKSGHGCGRDTLNSIFKTSDEETLKEITNNLEIKKSNKVYFIKEDGSEELVWER